MEAIQEQQKSRLCYSIKQQNKNAEGQGQFEC